MFPEWHHAVPESAYFNVPETLKTFRMYSISRFVYVLHWLATRLLLVTFEQMGGNPFSAISATTAFVTPMAHQKKNRHREHQCLLSRKARHCEWIDRRALRRTLFLTSLHRFIIRKTSMNAAGPADCCVSTTVQLR